MPQRIWRKNFELPRYHPQILYETAASFYNTHKYFKIPFILKEILTINEKGDNTGDYFLVHELRKVIDVILDKIIKNPKTAIALNKKIIEYHKISFNFYKLQDGRDLRKISDKNLYQIYRKLYDLMAKAHCSSLTINWLVESDNQDFSRFLLKYLEEQIKRLRLNFNAANVYSILTTPLENSFGRVEEIELLKLIKFINNNSQAQKIFSADFNKIKQGFGKLPPEIKEKILQHYKKWRWMPYIYIGPAYDLDYYLETISSFVRQKINVQKLLREYEEIHKINEKKQKKLCSELKINTNFRSYLKIARDSVYIKEYRKSCMYYGFYVMDKLLYEVAGRLGLSIMQVRYFTIKEARHVILKHKYNINEINQRSKFFVLHAINGKIKIMTGDKAKKFLQKQKFENVKIANVKELKGICACPGKVSGKAVIVNFQEEIGKIKEGEIMLAHTTFPALVPAMKKASAIVTEDGGVTCHAAIVSRELKKPCIVGVKNALSILKDGDKVEVDASAGTVRKIAK